MRADAPGTVEEVYRDLLARAPENKMQPRLEPMRRVLALLGDPQHAAPVIHLTGTNGKTSTARMIEAVLRAILRAGLYELAYGQEVPAKAVISEYVDLAHSFFVEKEPGLVNGMLDALARQLRTEEFQSAS